MCHNVYQYLTGIYILKTNFLATMERTIKNLELKKSGNLFFIICEFLSSKFNHLCFGI